MYPVVHQVLASLDLEIPREINGHFPASCQVCGRKCRDPWAAAALPNGHYWAFGHKRCIPRRTTAYFPAEDFESLAEILDWTVHLCVKRWWRHSFVEMVARVRPEWVPAVEEAERQYFRSLHGDDDEPNRTKEAI